MENKQGFFNSRSLFWGLGISLTIRVTSTSVWISMLLGLLMGIITLMLIKNKSNSNLIKTLTGLIFTILSISILAFMSSTLYLNETPGFILVVVGVIACYIISSIRNNSWKSFLNIMFFTSIFLFFTSEGLLLKDTLIENILPIFNTKISSILYGGLIFYLYSITPVITLNDIDDKKNLIINYISGCLSIILISIMSILVLGVNEAMLYRYPEYGLLKRIKVYEFFSNVDNIFVIIFVFDLLITGASGLRNMQFKSKYIKVIISILIILISTYLIESAKIMTFIYYYLPIILIIILILTITFKKE